MEFELLESECRKVAGGEGDRCHGDDEEDAKVGEEGGAEELGQL